MAKLRPPDELATRTFWIAMGGIGAFITVVFLFIL